MPYTATGKNNMLAALGATHVTAFSGDPSGAGTELASARQPISFNAPAAGSMDQAAAAIDIAVNAGTVDHIAYFSALTAGNLIAYDPVTAEVFAAAGTYRLTESTMSIT